MPNEPTHTRNPSLPTSAEGAQDTRENRVKDEVDKTEAEKERDTAPEDREPFDIDKVDDLKKAKKGEKEE